MKSIKFCAIAVLAVCLAPILGPVALIWLLVAELVEVVADLDRVIDDAMRTPAA